MFRPSKSNKNSSSILSGTTGAGNKTNQPATIASTNRNNNNEDNATGINDEEFMNTNYYTNDQGRIEEDSGFTAKYATENAPQNEDYDQITKKGNSQLI